MINTIRLINCTPFCNAEIADCKKVNLIYGANGSGKSTVSSFLAKDNSERFKDCELIMQDGTEDDQVYVYNKRFKIQNFKQTIPGVFTLGSATIEDLNELEKLKEELRLRKTELQNRLESYKSQKESLSDLQSDFKEYAWTNILKKNEREYKRAFEGLRNNKERFVTKLKKRINDVEKGNGKICDHHNLVERANALFNSKSERCNNIELNIKECQIKIDEIRNDSIWNTVIVGNADVDIAKMINDLEISSWVRQGRLYIRPYSNVCPFCQQNTITDEFKKKLEKIFDGKYQDDINKMEQLRSQYHDSASQIIDAINRLNENDNAMRIGNVNSEKLSDKCDLLKNIYSSNEKKINEKIAEPNIKISITDATSFTQEIINLIITANEKIDEYNKLVDQRETEEIILKNDVWATLINDHKTQIKSYKLKKRNIEKALDGIKKGLDNNNDLVDDLKSKIEEKEKNVTSVQPTIDEINRSLMAYGFTNFSIQRAEGVDNQYCIKRDDGTMANGTLSEGEETFLSFLYFMQWTKGSIDPEHVSDKKIIILDDPICSLDSNILYIVSAIIKNLSQQVLSEKGDVNQIFILTHNVFFHKEVSFINTRSRECKDVNYWIIRKNSGVSSIDAYKMKNPISSSYELLWQELRENDIITRISIQNTMRRIIENYFGLLGKNRDEYLLCKFNTPEDQMIARSLLYWINDGSHTIPDDLYIDTYTDIIPRYKDVFKAIFEKSGHIAHYNMMMGIDDE